MLETARLSLRFPTSEDVDLLYTLESDPDVQHFTFGTKTYEETAALITRILTDYKKTGLPWYLIFERQTGEFIGRAGFFYWQTGDIEMGYSFHKKFWGKGYATEVVSALIAWAQNNLEAEYISACSRVENTASFRVMEKCGMHYHKTSIEDGKEWRLYRIKNRFA